MHPDNLPDLSKLEPTIDVAYWRTHTTREHAIRRHGTAAILHRPGEPDADITEAVQGLEARVAAFEEAITFLFTPGPGIAVPEPYPEQEEYEPHK